jgi:hypothetical protein
MPSYRAIARYQDVDAVVLAYEGADGTRVVVVAADDCRTLTELVL